ncbi:hypothetical protein LIER_41777 [Lithospermum erythrorhizon]|uniref:Uncharacterized protein n=1 Tax=Lithospermum erythrorhizon TaxID=34254 RepID=A0AAV3RHU7_LITER
MDSEIIKGLLNCSLTAEEAALILLEEADLSDGIVGCEFSIYVKVHSYRDSFVNLLDFSMAMARAWNYKEVRVSRF